MALIFGKLPRLLRIAPTRQPIVKAASHRPLPRPSDLSQHPTASKINAHCKRVVPVCQAITFVATAINIWNNSQRKKTIAKIRQDLAMIRTDLKDVKYDIDEVKKDIDDIKKDCDGLQMDHEEQLQSPYEFLFDEDELEVKIRT